MNKTNASDTFEVWEVCFGSISKMPYRATKETATGFVINGRRLAKDSSWRFLRRSREECEALAADYRKEKENKDRALRIERSASMLLEALEAAYLAILCIPIASNEWRHRNQHVYAGLRDAIAHARGQEPQAVQQHFEAQAMSGGDK